MPAERIPQDREGQQDIYIYIYPNGTTVVLGSTYVIRNGMFCRIAIRTYCDGIYDGSRAKILAQDLPKVSFGVHLWRGMCTDHQPLCSFSSSRRSPISSPPQA